MRNPQQYSFLRPSRRNRLRLVTVGLPSTALMSIGSALAWADDGSIVLDFVRHGESIDNMKGIIDTTPPGTALDATGDATTIDTALQAGINQIDTALTQFPVEVFDDIVAALGGSI